MELEELKAEADKMGYRLVKKQGSNVLLPCTCGMLQPYRTKFCPDCGADMRGEREAVDD